jgi:hypothetical protein
VVNNNQPLLGATKDAVFTPTHLLDSGVVGDTKDEYIHFADKVCRAAGKLRPKLS